MKKRDLSAGPDEAMQAEYQFGAGVRGKYAQRYAQSSNVVVLAPDVVDVFRTSESVNDALRLLANLVRQRAAAPEGETSNDLANARYRPAGEARAAT